MKEKRLQYLSYLLRIWRVSDEKPVWRASLESPGTRERQGFDSLESLFDFLNMQLEPDAKQDSERKPRDHNGRAYSE